MLVHSQLGETPAPTRLAAFKATYIVKRGSNGGVRAMVSSRPSQNRKRKAKSGKTGEEKRYVIARG